MRKNRTGKLLICTFMAAVAVGLVAGTVCRAGELGLSGATVVVEENGKTQKFKLVPVAEASTTRPANTGRPGETPGDAQSSAPGGPSSRPPTTPATGSSEGASDTAGSGTADGRVVGGSGRGDSATGDMSAGRSSSGEIANAEVPIIFDQTAAPATVFAQATDLKPATHPLTTRYEWDFGDPNGRRNRLTGFNAAHVYDQPGTYVLTLTVTPILRHDASSKTSATVVHSEKLVPTKIYRRSITVAADNRRTYYVSAEGHDAGDGSAEKPLRTAEGVAKVVANNVRILFRRGEVFDVGSTLVRPGVNVLVGAYGESTLAQPVLRYTGEGRSESIIKCSEKTTGLTVQDLTFDSAEGENVNTKKLPHCVGLAGRQIVVRRCTFRNVSYGLNGNGRPSGVMLQDCRSPLEGGVRAYLAWIEGSDWVILDNRHANSTREHGLRGAGYERVLVAYNDVTNIARPTVDPVDIDKMAINLQAGTFAYVYANAFNGYTAFGPLGKADGVKHKEQRSRNFVIENNIFSRKWLGVQHGMNDIVIRNNRFLVDNNQAIEVDGYDSSYARGVSNLIVENNTGVNTGPDGSFLSVQGRVDGIILRGNTYSAPVLRPGANHTAALFIRAGDISDFKEISNNTWPSGRPNRYAHGGAMYVWPIWSDPKGYLTPAEWLKLPQVKGDRFEGG